MSGTHGVLADVMTASVNGEDRTIVTVLDDAMFVEADQTQCTKASRELRRLLTRHTGGRKRQYSSREWTAWKRGANGTPTTAGGRWGECSVAQDASQVKAAIMQ